MFKTIEEETNHIQITPTYNIHNIPLFIFTIIQKKDQDYT